MRVLIVDNGSVHVREIAKFFRDHGYEIIEPLQLNWRKVDPKTIVILSGGRRLSVLWHNRYYKNELELIRNYCGPIIGICLGFELIAHAFREPLHFLPRRKVGAITVRVTELGRKYFANDTAELESHRYSIRKLGKNFDILATSRNGIEFAKHKTRPIYGMQFHPEATRQGREILNKIATEIQ